MSVLDSTKAVSPTSACNCRNNLAESDLHRPGRCEWVKDGYERATAVLYTLAGPEPLQVWGCVVCVVCGGVGWGVVWGGGQGWGGVWGGVRWGGVGWW